MEMQPSFPAPGPEQHPMTVTFESEMDSEQTKAIISGLIDAKVGLLSNLPGHRQLCVVHGEDGHRLEWTRMGDERQSSYVVRDSDMRVLAESVDGKRWILGNGAGTCVIDDATGPKAVFDNADVKTYVEGVKRLDD